MINLFERKVKKMGDVPLLEECIIHLKMLSEYKVSKDSIIRANVLINEALSRSSLSAYHQEFNVAITLLAKI